MSLVDKPSVDYEDDNEQQHENDDEIEFDEDDDDQQESDIDDMFIDQDFIDTGDAALTADTVTKTTQITATNAMKGVQQQKGAAQPNQPVSRNIQYELAAFDCWFSFIDSIFNAFGFCVLRQPKRKLRLLVKVMN